MSQSETHSTLSDITLQKLTESISQYAATSLNSVSLPEFRGLPNEDVYDFLNKFKLATITFNDELRCLAMIKSLKGAAYTWAKNNLKTGSEYSDWKVMKKLIVERFASPDRASRYREKLTKLSFDPEVSTLMAHVEGYVDCYQKAYPNPSDLDVIRSLKINLPAKIVRNLNVLSHDWSESRTLGDLYKLIKRLDNDILPYEKASDTSGKTLDAATLTKILSDFKDSLKPKEDKIQETSTSEKLAAIQYQHRVASKPEYRNQWNQERQGPYYPRPNYRNRLSRNYQPYKKLEDEPVNRSLPMLQQYRNLPNQLELEYDKIHGKPPSPCYLCDGHHFNRHCPFKDLKPNGSGWMEPQTRPNFK